MANEEHLEILKQSVAKWNKWRLKGAIDPDATLTARQRRMRAPRDLILFKTDLSGARLSGLDLSDANLRCTDLQGSDLSGAELDGADLRRANLSRANLSNAKLRRARLTGAHLQNADLRYAEFRFADLVFAKLSNANMSHAELVRANLSEADLTGANLSGARLPDTDLSRAILRGANLSGFVRLEGADLHNADLTDADLSGANLEGANLRQANLTNTNLSGADLSYANLVETDLTNATITGCRIYGASAWSVTLKDTAQYNLIISKMFHPVVTVDNLEVGQFIYLMLNNTKIRDVINSITSKGVLILGRFSDPQRKSVLDGLREKLRAYDLLPMVFDFDCPTDKDYTETIQTLAGMSMFVIADLTNPKSTPLELEATVKQFKIPYVPIIDISVDPHAFSMLDDLRKSFHWVLPTLKYQSQEDLLDDDNLKEYVIGPVNKKRKELREAKNQEPETFLIPKKKVTAK